MGFLEYGSALRAFDELLRTASPEELKAIDSFVASRPEFTVYTNISRRIRTAPTSLLEKPDSQTGSFERRGFAWVVALARTELGAMLATFARFPSPFEVVRPSKFEMAAYKELLLDGSQTHYLALANDPEARKVARQIPDSRMLAYLRRLTMARHFLFAAVRSRTGELTPLQTAEVFSQKRDLEKAIGGYAASITDFVSALNYQQQSSKTSSTTKAMVNACDIQLRNEPAALAAGTARVTTPGGP